MYSLSQAEDSQDYFSDDDRERYQTGVRKATSSSGCDTCAVQPDTDSKTRHVTTEKIMLSNLIGSKRKCTSEIDQLLSCMSAELTRMEKTISIER